MKLIGGDAFVSLPAAYDVVCIYPHGFEEAEREQVLAAVAVGYGQASAR